MSSPIYCEYAGCFCIIPFQIENGCDDCELKNKSSAEDENIKVENFSHDDNF